MTRISQTMPAVLDPRRSYNRRRLTEAAQRALNEFYEQTGRRPWEIEHPQDKTPTTLTEVE